MQYTLRNIPPKVDAELRRKAKQEGRSLNAVAVESLVVGLGLAGERPRRRSLDEFVGTWQPDRETEAALDEQRKVDPEMWR